MGDEEWDGFLWQGYRGQIVKQPRSYPWPIPAGWVWVWVIPPPPNIPDRPQGFRETPLRKIEF